MASRVLVLNGPPGVGKTTVAKLLAARYPGTVCIHGDDLAAFAPPNKATHLGPGSTYRAAATLTAAYLAMGARAVIVDYCFLHGEHLAHYRDALPGDVGFRLVTLWAPLEVVEAREQSRARDPSSPRSPLEEKVTECWHLIDGHRDVLGAFVDATSTPPSDLAAALTL